MRPLYVAIPAWTPHYVSIALRFTVPAIMASIDAWNPRAVATFIVHTDDKHGFRAALGRHVIDFRTVVRGPGAQHESNWRAFESAHREAIERAPMGALLFILNSDLVVSVEAVRVVDLALRGRKKIGASVGIRTVLDGNSPPIGASAAVLARYIWEKRHPIITELIWGQGRSKVPTMLFFPHDGDAVSMHCFHLAPMFMVKDERPVKYSSTIDDNLLENYAPDEVAFFGCDQFAIAELSPLSKTHALAIEPMTVPGIMDFCRDNMRPSHYEHFKHRFTILGAPLANHRAADTLIARFPKAKP